MGKTRNQLYQRIVVKLGTGLVTGGSDRLNPEIMVSLAKQVSELHGQGRELIIVSSGAIASGRHKLGMSRKLKGIPCKQVLAAVGQSCLMDFYDRLFSQYDITVAQALLTKADLADRAGYLNARNTLLALLEMRVLPIVNENDVVAVDEIKEARFGDNDISCRPWWPIWLMPICYSFFPTSPGCTPPTRAGILRRILSPRWRG